MKRGAAFKFREVKEICLTQVINFNKLNLFKLNYFKLNKILK